MWARKYFNPAAESFSWRNAHLLACAAELAYENAAKVEARVRRKWGFEEFEFFDEEDTQAFVAAGAGAVIVCFRGTEPDALADITTDIDTSLIAGPWGSKVHEGFYNALSKVWRQLDGFVDAAQLRTQRKYGRATVWFTGHSLGAALANLAVARRLERNKPVDGMYTFGQPRAGDSTFARTFDFEFKSSAFRFVNNNDIVTRIPPRAMGYQHCGSFRYFTETGEFTRNIDWWRGFLDSWHGRVQDFLAGEFDDINDHSMTLYRKLIEGEVLSLVKQQAAASPPDSGPTILKFEQAAAKHIVPRRRAA